jgi:hypothetical protein
MGLGEVRQTTTQAESEEEVRLGAARPDPYHTREGRAR